jgi:hypothetical protein
VSDSTSLTLTREQERLALALGDMRQAAAAAGLLDRQLDVHGRHAQLDIHARRALETAISTCYARPWIDSKNTGKLKKKWLPSAHSDRAIHKRLLKLRRKTYAHTDPAGGRKALVQLGPDNVLGIGEEWIPLRRAELPAIADLCDRQAARFSQALVDALDGAPNSA